MSRLDTEHPDSDISRQSVASDVLFLQEPDEDEEDEEEDEDGDGNQDDDEEDTGNDGYSE